ncbi:MAG: flagellar hook-basal body protein [Armatimonadetes bacterium]|nr:flagellar hook-basal body protein [Armatimonadota bacterium]
MLRGLYRSAAGMLAQAATQDALANNLANTHTSGFKRQIPTVTFSAVWQAQVGERAAARRERLITEYHTDFTQGELHRTEGATDLALDGPDFFVVRTPQGERLTRGGSFHVAPSGELVDASGAVLLGKAGPIRPGAGPWQIREDGTVLAAGQAVDQIRLASRKPSGPPPERLGEALFVARDLTAAPPGETHVLQGWIEQPNLDPVREMVSMIAALRAYEMAQRAVTAQDETLERAINDVGRTR